MTIPALPARYLDQDELTALVGDVVAGWWRQNLSDPVAMGSVVKRLDRGSVFLFTRKFGVEVAHRGVIFFFMLMTFFFLLRDGDSLVIYSVGRDLKDDGGRPAEPGAAEGDLVFRLR